MERFRKKVIVTSDMPDGVILGIAHNMAKEASSLGFAPYKLTFYMGDIPYNSLINKSEVISGSPLGTLKIYGIPIIRLLNEPFDNKGELILESKTSFMDGVSLKGISYDEAFRYRMPLKHKIKKVIFNDPATIILWKDGTKTVVQTQGEDYDPEKGMAMAIAKKALGNEGNYYDIFKEWLPEEDDEDYYTFDSATIAFKKLGEAFRNALGGPTIETTTCISKDGVENIIKCHEDSFPKKIDIIFDNKEEAEAVLNAMKAVLSMYGSVNVADCYTLTLDDYKYAKTDSLYGWTNLDEARVEFAGGNYFIILPKVVRLNKAVDSDVA